MRPEGRLMDLGLAGRTALIVGSTSGLGLAIGRSLAAEGANVVLSGRRGGSAESEAAALPAALGVELDLANPASVRAAVSAATARYGDIDILVLNGGGPQPGSARELAEEEIADALHILLLAQIALTRLVLPKMQHRGWGRVLAIGSSGVQQPIPNLVASNVARSGLAAYLKTLADEVASDGVTVNMILPGRIDTDRVASLDAHRAGAAGVTVADIRRESEMSIPLKRYGTPAEFADVGAFLCSERASYVTGSQVRVDGGLIRSL
jgi:3-oxoacyl-[acyl-carrier protein] reductase